MKKYTSSHTITQETHAFSKNYCKIHEKVYKFPYNYSRNIQFLRKYYSKIHAKVYKKVEIFHNIIYNT